MYDDDRLGKLLSGHSQVDQQSKEGNFDRKSSNHSNDDDKIDKMGKFLKQYKGG